MSVLKSKRKPSQFEVFHHLNKVRKEVTDLLLRDFGYSKRKAAQRLEKKFSGRSYEELTDVEKEIYDHFRKQQEAFDTWFIEDERKAVVDCLRSIGEHVYTANSILSEKDFDDWFRSWFNGHCHYMSKLQRSNMLDLCKKLKEEHYYGKTDFS